MSEIKRPSVRGQAVSAATLLSQVENTAPFLFTKSLDGNYVIPSGPRTGYLEILRKAKDQVLDTDLWAYYDLCLAAHFATVGTFVPTDVDLAIRLKLWTGVHHENAFLPMWERIQEFHHWDETIVSKRLVYSPSGKKLSGHQGEWFTVAMAAYGSAGKVAKTYLGEIRESIEAEIKNQEDALTELFETFREAPSIETMKALLAGIAAVAHNLGDLDRMFDTWEISDHDVLKRRVYRAGHEDARHPREVFIKAGKIYKSLLAQENHRHFPMREPKCLRLSNEFLLPFGPFFDDWGMSLIDGKTAKALLGEGELRIVAEALILGWKKLNPLSIYTSQGYSRALDGFAMAYGNQIAAGNTTSARLNLLPPVLKKEINEGGLRTLMAFSQSEFEKKWLVKLKSELAALDTPAAQVVKDDDLDFETGESCDGDE
jgi:hypothetical protein